MLTETETHVDALLAMLPAEDRAEAKRILAAVPYPAHRLFAACQSGAIDCWELKSALQKMKLDCPQESVR